MTSPAMDSRIARLTLTPEASTEINQRKSTVSKDSTDRDISPVVSSAREAIFSRVETEPTLSPEDTMEVIFSPADSTASTDREISPPNSTASTAMEPVVSTAREAIFSRVETEPTLSQEDTREVIFSPADSTASTDREPTFSRVELEVIRSPENSIISQMDIKDMGTITSPVVTETILNPKESTARAATLKDTIVPARIRPAISAGKPHSKSVH